MTNNVGRRQPGDRPRILEDVIIQILSMFMRDARASAIVERHWFRCLPPNFRNGPLLGLPTLEHLDGQCH